VCDIADELNLFALAIRSRMGATDLKHMLFAYPTSGSYDAHALERSQQDYPFPYRLGARMRRSALS